MIDGIQDIVKQDTQAMNSLEITRDYIGQDLTVQYARELAKAPEEHIAGLIQRLAPYYYDWLENEENNQAALLKSRDFCIDPFSPNLNWLQRLEQFKKHLLYFPSFVIPDPLASFLWPDITLAVRFG